MATIMVVEDVDDIREMVAETLRLEGFDVLEAEHGRHALELLDTAPEPPSLILLDLMMPVMGGAELLSVLGQRDLLDKIPVIVVSAGGDSKDVPQATVFLRKPPSHDELVSLVHRLCARTTSR